MKDFTIPATVHGRYLADAASPGDGRPLLVGFHGYGQRAEHMAEELARLSDAGSWRVAAVQALHPFYSKADTVVASWMTRLDREHAIADNIAYVREAIADIARAVGKPSRLALVGFSQGVAMAYRAAACGGHPCHGVVALAGDVPPELERAGGSLPPVLIGRGTGDAWYTAEKHANDLRVLGTLGVSVASVVFTGAHEWTDEFREAARDFLRRLR